MTEEKIRIDVSVSNPGTFRARFRRPNGRDGAITVGGRSWTNDSDPHVTHEMRLRIIEKCERLIDKLQDEYSRAVDSMFCEKPT